MRTGQRSWQHPHGHHADDDDHVMRALTDAVEEIAKAIAELARIQAGLGSLKGRSGAVGGQSATATTAEGLSA